MTIRDYTLIIFIYLYKLLNEITDHHFYQGTTHRDLPTTECEHPCVIYQISYDFIPGRCRFSMYQGSGVRVFVVVTKQCYLFTRGARFRNLYPEVTDSVSGRCSDLLPLLQEHQSGHP